MVVDFSNVRMYTVAVDDMIVVTSLFFFSSFGTCTLDACAHLAMKCTVMQSKFPVKILSSLYPILNRIVPIC